MDWRTWSMMRAAMVARSTSRRRIFRVAPQQPPDLLVLKYTRLFDAAARRILFHYAQHAFEMRRRTDAVMPLVKTIGDLNIHYADLIETALKPLADAMVKDVNESNLGGMTKTWRQVVGLPFTDKPELTAALAKHREENVDLIKGLAGDALARIRQAMDDTQGEALDVVQRALLDAVSVGAARARLIARDQTLKINGNLTKVRHESAGITKYEWVTSQDERVRPSHRALNGKEFEWSKPPVVDHKRGRHEHPGGDYQCRCIANPVIDLDALDTPDPVPAPKAMLPKNALPKPKKAPSVKLKPPAPAPVVETPPVALPKPVVETPPTAHRLVKDRLVHNFVPRKLSGLDEKIKKRNQKPLKNDIASSFSSLPITPALEGIPYVDHFHASVQYPNNHSQNSDFSRHIEEASKPYEAEVGKEGMKAINTYTGSAYTLINRYMRNDPGERDHIKRVYGEEKFKQIEEIVGRISRAIDMLPKAPENMVLFRGLTVKNPAFLDEMASATQFESKSILSTSRDPRVARGFAGGEDNPDYTVLFRVKQHQTGAILSPAYSSESEQEVLFKPGTRFKIVGRQRVDHQTLVVDLEEAV